MLAEVRLGKTLLHVGKLRIILDLLEFLLELLDWREERRLKLFANVLRERDVLAKLLEVSIERTLSFLPSDRRLLLRGRRVEFELASRELVS